MSVRIVIKPGGVFENPTANQSDLVFWYNSDTEAHYPIPGCTGLRVEPGKTTKDDPYLPSPVYTSVADTPPPSPPVTPYLPHTFDYTCAIHGETGQITINADSGQIVSLTPPVGSLPPKEIVIGKGGTFASVDVQQSQTVFWTNNDDVVHFPVPNCTGLSVQPQGVTNSLQIVPVTVVPMAIWYGCAVEGHESESGTINVYGDFRVLPVTLSSATPYAQATVIPGGKSPYVIEPDGSVGYITIFEITPVGSSGGIAMVLNAPPPANETSVDYLLKVSDALGNKIDQTITITLT